MSAGDVVDAMCSGVWGSDQGSFRLTVEEDRCLVERTRWNAKVRETRLRGKIDIAVDEQVAYDARHPFLLFRLLSSALLFHPYMQAQL